MILKDADHFRLEIFAHQLLFALIHRKPLKIK